MESVCTVALTNRKRPPQQNLIESIEAKNQIKMMTTRKKQKMMKMIKKIVVALENARRREEKRPLKSLEAMETMLLRNRMRMRQRKMQKVTLLNALREYTASVITVRKN